MRKAAYFEHTISLRIKKGECVCNEKQQSAKSIKKLT